MYSSFFKRQRHYDTFKRKKISIKRCCHNKRASCACIPRSLSVSDNMTRLSESKYQSRDTATTNGEPDIHVYNPSNIFARARLVQTRHVTEYSPTKTGEYQRIYPDFQICARCVKDKRIINTIVSIWGENMLGYLSLDIICSSKLTFFLELRSRKTVRFSEQIMSADKYPSIFSRQMETIVYILRSLA